MNYRKASDFYSAKQLPADANARAFSVARQYNDAGLLTMLKHAQEKRLWGEATHIDKNGRPVAIFNFTKGLCMRYNPIEWIDSRNVFKESVKFYE